MTDLDLVGLREIAGKATEGPWHWAGNTDAGEPYLATWVKGAGRCQILSIGAEDRATTGPAAEKVRSDAVEFGLGDPDELVHDWAHDRFGEPVRDPRLQFMTDLMCVNARDLAVYEVAPEATTRDDPSVYRADVAGIRHPDADHIAAFDPPTVLALLDLIAEQQAELAEYREREAASLVEWGTAPVIGGRVSEHVSGETTEDSGRWRVAESPGGIEYRLFKRLAASPWVEVIDGD